MQKAARVSRKEKIIKAAIKCFTKSGVAQTKFKDIAEAAGIDQPLINYYFPNSEALYLEVVQFILKDLNDFVLDKLEGAGTNAKKALSAYVESYFAWSEENPTLGSLWLFFYHLASHRPAFEQLNQMIRRAGQERISVLLYKGIEQEEFKPTKGQPVQELAVSIQAVLTGFVIQAGTESSTSGKEIKGLCLKAVGKIIHCNFE